jgi:hypothetical protein
MASLLPIIGTVGGSMIGGPIGGAIGGAAGSALGSYADKGKLESGDILKAALSGGLGYVGAGGLSGAGAAGAGAAGAADAAGAAAIPAAPLAAAGTGGATATSAIAPVSASPFNFSPTLATAAPVGAAAAPAAAGMPQLPPAGPGAISAPNIPATPTGWFDQPGMLGMNRGQMIGYGGLGALGMLDSGGGAQPVPMPVHQAPTLSTAPTQRNYVSPSAAYQPGREAEHRYFQAARGGLVPMFDKGGEVEGGGGYGGDVSGSSSADGGSKSGGDVGGGGYQGGGGDKGGGSFGGSIDSGSGMSSVGVGPGPIGGGDPWGAGISNTGYSGGLDAGPGTGMGGGVGGAESAGLGATRFGPAPTPAALAPRMAMPAMRDYMAPPAGYRPGIDPQATLFKPGVAPAPGAAPAVDASLFSPMASIMPVAAPVTGMADGGMTATSRTVSNAPRFVQRSTGKSWGPERLLGMPGLFGLYSDDESEWVEDKTPVAPTLATTPVDRGYMPAPAGYRPGIDPEHRYFTRDFSPAAVRLPGDPAQMAAGGLANAIPGYIRGDGDGVSDSVRGTIDGREPVDLSVGEFVVPARTVSGLGNGSSEAGARKLHRMMRRIDQARARMGNSNIDETKVLPA